MARVYEAIPIAEGFYWVGAVDWGLRDFHGYATHRGTTYNSYLMTTPSGRNVVFDGVKEPFVDTMLSRIASVVDPASVDTVVSNHAEMDHSGGLPRLCAALSPSRILASQAGVKNLSMQLEGFSGVTAVGDGEVVDLGGEQAVFMETRMLHWPDSMFSYLPSRRILVSQDAFGMHLASAELFAHRVDRALLREEAGRYYANILMPYSRLVTALLSKVASAGLTLDVIAPDHGPVWVEGREPGPSFITGLYAEWAAQKPTRKAVVSFDTMWKSTETMALAIAEGLEAGGATSVVLPLHGSHRSDVAYELLEAGALLLGTPTINNNLFPTVADLVAYLRGLRRQNLVGAAFGSHGWSGEGVRQLSAAMAEMKIDLLHPGLSVQFRPDGSALSACRELGAATAARLAAGEA